MQNYSAKIRPKPQGQSNTRSREERCPFDIQRIYYLYDVPGGVSRGGHAHKQLQQVIVSVMGAFDVIADDGYNKKTVHLYRAYFGLYIPTMIWRELDNVSSGAICLVLASQQYDEMDYYRNYEEFIKSLKQRDKSLSSISES